MTHQAERTPISGCRVLLIIRHKKVPKLFNSSLFFGGVDDKYRTRPGRTALLICVQHVNLQSSPDSCVQHMNLASLGWGGECTTPVVHEHHAKNVVISLSASACERVPKRFRCV